MKSRIWSRHVLVLVLGGGRSAVARVGCGLVGGGRAPDEKETVAGPGERLYGGANDCTFLCYVRSAMVLIHTESRARGCRCLALFRAPFRACCSSLALNRARWRVDRSAPDASHTSLAKSSGRYSRQCELADAPRIHRRLRRARAAFIHCGFDCCGPGATQPFPRAALYAFDSGAAPGAGRNHHRARE